MKAAILYQTGTPLEVKEIASPALHASSVRVRVLATPILSFTHLVVGGQFPFPLPTPYTPGLCAIGTVDEVADDVTGLQEGQKVFCSPLIAARNNSEAPERILKGWVGLTPDCGNLLAQWKEGTFAEQAVYPLESITLLDGLDDYDDAKLACMYYLCIAYGAFLRGEFQPGQAVLITGATGNLGTASVLVALAMGASRVYAVGRNSTVLHSLAAMDPKRILGITLPEKAEEYGSVFAEASGQVDMMLDAVGITDETKMLETGMSLVKPRGTVVFAGGVTAPVPLPYLTTLVKELNIKGSSMYPSYAPAHIARMIQSGLLNLNAFRPITYPLQFINEAIAQAAGCRGFEYCILQPHDGQGG